MLSQSRYHEYAVSPLAFLDDLTIDRAGKPTRFGDCMDPFQRRDFEAMSRAWLACVGRIEPAAGQPMRAMQIRPRGHSKSSDLGAMCAWALSFAAKPIRGYGAAGDKDQARILRDSIAVLCRLNPLLGTILETQNYAIRNVADRHPANGSSLEILASDVASSWGLLAPSFICADEPSHWSDSAEEFWISLLSAAAKRSNSLVSVIANAGFRSHWFFKLVEAVRESPRWYFSSLDGPVASWISREELAEQQRLLPPSQYARLWQNEFQDQTGDALPADQIRDCVCRVSRLRQRIDRWLYCALLDLSWKRDNTALILAACDFARQKVVVCDEKVWRPRELPTGEICFSKVADEIRAYKRLVNCGIIIADAWQSLALLQQFEAENFEVHAICANAGRKSEEAKALLEMLDRRQIETFEGSELAKDLRRARTIERPGLVGGIRIELPRDNAGGGHADSLAALMVGLPNLRATLEERDPRGGGEDEDRYEQNPYGAPEWQMDVSDDIKSHGGFESRPWREFSRRN